MSEATDRTMGVREALRTELSTLTTEMTDERYANLDLFETEHLVALMNEQDQTVPAAVQRVLPNISAAIDGIVDRMRDGGRLVYIGTGTPGRLGVLDASECPPTFSVDASLVVGIIAGGDVAIRTAVENAEDDVVAGGHDLAAINVGAQDVVVGISASGRTPYVIGGLKHANDAGALTVAIACNANSPIGIEADHAIEVVVGPEVIAGSTRLKAGTAQKLVLNMLSTVSMVRLGKTHGNVMIDVKATNEKLRARAERAVMLVTGCTADQAERALAAGDDSVKTAALMLLAGLTGNEAREVLAATGSLRAALTTRS